jgi:hypothetical protein
VLISAWHLQLLLRWLIPWLISQLQGQPTLSSRERLRAFLNGCLSSLRTGTLSLPSYCRLLARLLTLGSAAAATPMPDEDADEAPELLQLTAASAASKATEEDSASAAAAVDTSTAAPAGKSLLSSRRSKQEQPPAYRALGALCRLILQETQPKLTYAVALLSCVTLLSLVLAPIQFFVARPTGELVPAFWDTSQASDQQPGIFADFFFFFPLLMHNLYLSSQTKMNWTMSSRCLKRPCFTCTAFASRETCPVAAAAHRWILQVRLRIGPAVVSTLCPLCTSFLRLTFLCFCSLASGAASCAAAGRALPDERCAVGLLLLHLALCIFPNL